MCPQPFRFAGTCVMRESSERTSIRTFPIALLRHRNLHKTTLPIISFFDISLSLFEIFDARDRLIKRYMNKWVLLGLKVIIALVWLACLWSQTFAAPILSEAMAGLYSSQVAMRWPYLIMGILFLVCVEIAFAAVWRPLSLSGSGTVFTAKAMPCVNWVLGCAAIATALTVLVSLCFLISGWHDATMPAMDYYTIALVLGVAILAEIGFMLLMVVMKGLMHLFQRR